MTNDDFNRFGDKREISENQQGHRISDWASNTDARELSIGDIARYARDAFPWAIAGAFIVGALALAVLVFIRLASPSDTYYRTSLVVTMSGAAAGKYPNGTDFSLTDLRSPVVLESVFQNKKLAEYNITLADFLGMITVDTYSPAYDSVTARFRARLESKTLTFEERKAVEAEFSSALEGLGSKGILVTLTVPEGMKIPALLAQQVVDDIPVKWASIFIERLGVANLPVPVSGSELIDVKFLNELDYPLAYDYLADQASRLQSQLEAIGELPGSISFISTKSGKGIADLKREADAIDQYRIKLNLKPIVDQGLSRDPTVTVLIYKNQIRSLEKDAVVQSQYSGKVTTVISDFRSNKGAPLAGAPLSAAAPAAVGTQFDGAFVDKIIELSKQGAGVEFEQGLLQKKLEMENLNVSYTDQMGRLIERRDAIVSNTLTPQFRSMLEDKFMAGLKQATSELNKLWTDSFAFVDELNQKRLNFDKSLYRLNELPESKRMERPDIFTRRDGLIAVSLILIGAMAGFLSFAWRRAVKSR